MQKREDDFLMNRFLEKMTDCGIGSRERRRSLTETLKGILRTI